MNRQYDKHDHFPPVGGSAFQPMFGDYFQEILEETETPAQKVDRGTGLRFELSLEQKAMVIA